MKIGVLTAVWKRSDLARLCLEAIAHARDAVNNSDRLELDVLVVGSECASSGSDALSLGFRYLDAANEPLGSKWDNGMAQFQGRGVYGVIAFGSDDFLEPKVYTWAANRMRDGYKFGGLSDIVFLTPGPTASYWPGYVGPRAGELSGCGRFLRADLLDRVCWRPWPNNAPKGLDGGMWRLLRPWVRDEDVATGNIESVGMMFDVKSDPSVDVSKFKDFESAVMPRDFTEVTAWLPENIRSRLASCLSSGKGAPVAAPTPAVAPGRLPSNVQACLAGLDEVIRLSPRNDRVRVRVAAAKKLIQEMCK